MKKKAPAKIIFFSSFLTALLLVFVLDGYVHNSIVEDFYFIEYSGLKRELFAEPKDTSDSGNDLISLDGKLSTPFYHLGEGLQINDHGRSFFVIYSADCPLTLRLKINDEYLLADLPNISGRQVEFRYPLGRNALFQGFQLESTALDGSLNIIGSGVEDNYAGADFSGNPALVGHGVKILSNQETMTTEVQVFSEIPGFSAPDILQLGLRTENPDPIVLHLKDGDNELRKLELRRPERYGQLSLYVSSLGFFPESITIEGPATSIETFGFYQTPSGGEPIPMDFASILRYPNEKWRKAEYELFRWSVDPKVLVFDFIDYSTQAAFFKRLAFFVEKDGYQGRLLTNQELEKLHGWNAHDYRMEDIARFYQQAEESDFILNPEELEFKEILITEGVLSQDENGSYHFINGAVISISRESMDYLRRLFLTHEGFHGIFFTDPGFREHTARLWEGFSSLEKDFWRMFLRWRGYDPRDGYLVQNELQAYLLQQPVSMAHAYFIDYTLPRMARLYPESADLIEELITRYPEHFENSAAFLEEYISASLGLRGGDLENLKYFY